MISEREEWLDEGWWMPPRSTRYHYFVEGRSLCGGWMFPDYSSLSTDTDNEEAMKEDCKACFKKLVKRRKILENLGK